MTLTVITPGRFTAPGLPDLGALGFTDTFSRGDATTLGRTEAPRRDWATYSTGPIEAGIASGTAYIRRLENVSAAYAVAESHTSDGTVEVVLANIVPQNQREVGMLFRYSDTNNMWRFVARDGTSFRLVRYMNGGFAYPWMSDGITPQNGDRLAARLDGDSITLFINEQQVFQTSDAFNQTATMHGFYGNSNAPVASIDRIAEISVSPL